MIEQTAAKYRRWLTAWREETMAWPCKPVSVEALLMIDLDANALVRYLAQDDPVQAYLAFAPDRIPCIFEKRVQRC